MVTEGELSNGASCSQEMSGSEMGSPLLDQTVITEKSSDSINANPLPHGKYTVIGVDIDTTGRRLIDEIVQISAYTPTASFSQYIMPLMNLNPAARQRHQVRVITVGFFRMLKSMQTYKVVKTKTEISALNEFIEWIEQRRREDEGSQGVILIYHEQRKFVPYMIIEAMKKYNLLDKFMTTVKSFANGFKLAEEKCSKTIKYFSILQLAKIVFENDGSDQLKAGFEGNAYVRAKLAYEIAKHLVTEHKKKTDPNDETSTTIATETDTSKTGDDEEDHSNNSNASCTVSDEEEMERMVNTLCDLASPITQELNELDEQEKILVRQNSLRPVFLQYFKTTLYHRVKAVTYRRVLAEYGHDIDSLLKIWTDDKREGLAAEVQKIDDLKDDERAELVDILDCHFDPEKQSLKPVVKRQNRRPSGGRPFLAKNNQNMNNTQMSNGHQQNMNNDGPIKDNRIRSSNNGKNYNNNQPQQDGNNRRSPRRFRGRSSRRRPVNNKGNNNNMNMNQRNQPNMVQATA